MTKVNAATVQRLLEFNRKFYAERGPDFSETRHRVQPGVRRIAESLQGHETILDLGCGNGTFARLLSRQGHRGRYVGVDSSGPLLQIARRGKYAFPVEFAQVDLLNPQDAHVHILDEILSSLETGLDRQLESHGRRWMLITAFAFLHHIPGEGPRLELVRRIHGWLHPKGQFIHSNWQISTSSRLMDRVQDWSGVGLDGLVDGGDYLVQWRHGGPALRYVHEYDEAELAGLAKKSGFVTVEVFYSDGENRQSGLYQVWRPS
jgi:SAM-dependent methyltransferase